MPRRPSSRPRPNLSAAEEADSVDDVEQLGEPDADESVDDLDESRFPYLDVVHVHEEAVSIAEERGLSSAESQELIRERQIRNHERTKADVVEGLRESVAPRDEESYRRDREYFDRLLERVDDVFSTTAEQQENSSLEREFAEVLRIESIRDPRKRAVEKKRYVRGLTERLNCRPQHAEALYQRLASRLDDYRQLQKQRQALLLLEHSPEAYDEFITLTRAGDDAGIDQLFDSIGDPTVRTQLQTLRATERLTAAVVERRDGELTATARREFGESVDGFDSLSPERQILLGSVAESASDEFLAVARAAGLTESESGFAGEFLDRPLVIDDTGAGYLGVAAIPTLNGAGLQAAAVVDHVDLKSFHVFDELAPEQTAAFLPQLLPANRRGVVPARADLQRVGKILDVLDLRESAADGWMTLREFELIDNQAAPNCDGIRRLMRQLDELAGPSSAYDGVRLELLRRILSHWQSEGETPARSTILSATEVEALDSPSAE